MHKPNSDKPNFGIIRTTFDENTLSKTKYLIKKIFSQNEQESDQKICFTTNEISPVLLMSITNSVGTGVAQWARVFTAANIEVLGSTPRFMKCYTYDHIVR